MNLKDRLSISGLSNIAQAKLQAFAFMTLEPTLSRIWRYTKISYVIFHLLQQYFLLIKSANKNR
jgi:hypothetical protein